MSAATNRGHPKIQPWKRDLRQPRPYAVMGSNEPGSPGCAHIGPGAVFPRHAKHIVAMFSDELYICVEDNTAETPTYLLPILNQGMVLRSHIPRHRSQKRYCATHIRFTISSPLPTSTQHPKDLCSPLPQSISHCHLEASERSRHRFDFLSRQF